MKFLLSTLLVVSFAVNSATIAVIDSGVDVEHKDLLAKIWTNSVDIPNNNRDEDGNGYQDDFYGWNFAENNNLVIDRKYIGSFSSDPYKFFEIQGRMFLNQATEADKKWLRTRTDKEFDQFDEELSKKFRKEMGIFGNFVHGTHVAGITQKENPQAKILSVKLIPTEVNPFGKKRAKIATYYKSASADFRMKLLKKALKELAKVQITQLEEIAHYVGSHGADIANGSFGTGFKQAKMITNNIFKVFFFRKPSEAESDEVAIFFLNSLVKEGKKMADAAPNTLFVFAAGNDASDNDKYPTSPTNIQADNVISVAATYKYEFIAPFSNYGEKLVDIAAPGMLIHSQIPGDEYLKVSGTSQAAPFVAKVAAMVKDSNNSLTPREIKEILLGTVDKKSFLSGKVKTSGIINSRRAVYAAKKSLEVSVRDAIREARSRVGVMRSSKRKSRSSFNLNAIIPIPLTSTFNL